MTSHSTMAVGSSASSAKLATSETAASASKTSITDARRPLGDGGYAGQIDAFAVYCPQIERVYLVPIAVVKTTIGARLRLKPAKNGQTWNIRWARDFELAH